MKREHRIDRIRIRFDGPVTRDERGYARLWGTVVPANVLLRYTRADGLSGDRVELVPEDTVNDAAAMNTLLFSPITNLHPPSMLDAKTTNRHQIGSVIDTKFEDGKLQALGLFTDSTTLDDIDGGMVETSPGYTAIIDETPGELNGAKYDAIQRGRRYNHWAIVPAARAGHANALQIDGAPASDIMVQRLDEDRIETHDDDSEDTMADGTTTETKTDGPSDTTPPAVEPPPPPPTTPEVEPPKSAADELRELYDALSPEKIVTQVSDQVVTKLRADEETKLAATRARAAIVDAAKPAVGPNYKFDGKPDKQVMVDAIAARQPDLKARADASEGDALRGMFEAIMAIPQPKTSHALGNEATDKTPKTDAWTTKYDCVRKHFFSKRTGGTDLCRDFDNGVIEIAVGGQ